MKLLKELIQEQLNTVRVAVSGDVMFGRYVGYGYHPIELTVEKPFEAVKKIFKDSDLALVNLETALFDEKPTWWKKYPLPSENYQLQLVSPTDSVQHLVDAGINCVSLANNHSDDAGLEGFESTQKVLDDAGILHSGTCPKGDPFAPTLFDINNKKIAFFSITFKRNFGNDWGNVSDYPIEPLASIDGAPAYEKFLERVEQCRSEHPDAFIITSVHWGEQWSEKVGVWQEIVAVNIIDAGTNCLVGHHPHVLQKVALYKDAVIFFSLGNFLFCHNYDRPGHASKENENTKNGAIYTFDITKDNKIVNLKRNDTQSTPEGVILP